MQYCFDLVDELFSAALTKFNKEDSDYNKELIVLALYNEGNIPFYRLCKGTITSDEWIYFLEVMADLFTHKAYEEFRTLLTPKD